MFKSLLTAVSKISLRSSVSVIRNYAPPQNNIFSLIPKQSFSVMSNFKINPEKIGSTIINNFNNKRFLEPSRKSLDNQTRGLIKFSLIKGKRKSVKCVLKRFKRLDWGIWIRTHSGRHKKLFKKSPALKRRLKQHVFVNGTQSWLLDSMVTNYWRKPKYYVDDPYEQYHKREEYFATRKKPIEFPIK